MVLAFYQLLNCSREHSPTLSEGAEFISQAKYQGSVNLLAFLGSASGVYLRVAGPSRRAIAAGGGGQNRLYN